MSEYDLVFHAADREGDGDDLEAIQRRFGRAAGPYLSSPLSWVLWAAALPAAALLTPRVATAFGPRGVLLLWSGAILLGGAGELRAFSRVRARRLGSPLAQWAFRAQGNLSLVALLLSGLLLWAGLASWLPALWLLLLGHSFYILGGLAAPPLRSGGLIYQLGGLAALWPGGDPLVAFAVAMALGNLWIAWGLRRPDGG